MSIQATGISSDGINFEAAVLRDGKRIWTSTKRFAKADDADRYANDTVNRALARLLDDEEHRSQP